MSEFEPIASWNGETIPFSSAALPVTDLGVVAGASVTEMIRTFGHRPDCVGPHLDRLEQSMRLTGITSQMSRDDITAAIDQVVTHNARLIPDNHDLGIIAFVTAGPNLTYFGAAGRDQVGRGVTCIHTFPLPFELWASAYADGQHLATVDTVPVPQAAVDPRAKHRNRLHWLQADRQARERFPSARALLLDATDAITETSSGNVFAVRNQMLFTPPVESVLGGICRQRLIEIAVSLNIPVSERAIRLSELQAADEVLTTSTPYCVAPVTHLNGQLIGTGRPGPLFQRLLSAWSRIAGVDIASQAFTAARERTM